MTTFVPTICVQCLKMFSIKGVNDKNQSLSAKTENSFENSKSWQHKTHHLHAQTVQHQLRSLHVFTIPCTLIGFFCLLQNLILF